MGGCKTLFPSCGSAVNYNDVDHKRLAQNKRLSAISRVEKRLQALVPHFLAFITVSIVTTLKTTFQNNF